MRAVDLIRRKRDGETLDAAAIQAFVAGATDESWPDYQVSAMLMAIVLRGMTTEETADLTDAMTRSGTSLSFRDIGRPLLDKHSTGGVGDKISFVLAPLVAACGGTVPMMSGRGLGHTGGTIDKFESIPGIRTGLTEDDMRRVLATAGCCITAPTTRVAPADRRLYALRDVTATVDSIPLITGSILSKKLAEGLDALVLDVKVGLGAFMKTEEAARQLAESLVGVGRRLGLRVEALLTRMDAPLGAAVGNALEIIEVLATLRGTGPADITELSVAQAARLLALGGLADDAPAATARARDALASGAALVRFRDMVREQGGDVAVVDDPSRLDVATDRHDVCADRDGVLCCLHAELVGTAAVSLGAGRAKVEDPVDPGVGIIVHQTVGTRLHRGDRILTLYHRAGRGLDDARLLVSRAIVLGDGPPPVVPLILSEVR
jgi:pyrimidine-nucleoside phosphorylase